MTTTNARPADFATEAQMDADILEAARASLPVEIDRLALAYQLARDAFEDARDSATATEAETQDAASQLARAGRAIRSIEAASPVIGKLIWNRVREYRF